MSPREAFKNGASAIVIGRSITKGDIKNNIQKLIKSLNLINEIKSLWSFKIKRG